MSNLNNTAKALPTYVSPKNIALVTKHGIFTEAEFRARHEIHLDAYCKIIGIDARTMLDMAIHQILPAAMAYASDLSEGVLRKRQVMVAIGTNAELKLIDKLALHSDALYRKCEKLKEDLCRIPADSAEAAKYCSEVIVEDMASIRTDADVLEAITAKRYWPYPTYSDILFY